jgi:putative NADH-flavin reductase
MKVLILGATGATGLKLIERALTVGHQVTAYVRNPDKLENFKNKITIIHGELTEEQKLIESIAGHDAVLSVLGYRTFKEKSMFISKTMALTIKGMEQHKVSRILYLSSSGIGGKDSMSNPLVRFLLKLFGLINPFKDHFQTEKLLKQSNLNWTITRPGRLTDGEALERYREQEELKGFIKISRADVAHFIIAALTNDKLFRKSIDLGY